MNSIVSQHVATQNKLSDCLNLFHCKFQFVLIVHAESRDMLESLFEDAKLIVILNFQHLFVFVGHDCVRIEGVFRNVM